MFSKDLLVRVVKSEDCTVKGKPYIILSPQIVPVLKKPSRVALQVAYLTHDLQVVGLCNWRPLFHAQVHPDLNTVSNNCVRENPL